LLYGIIIANIEIKKAEDLKKGVYSVNNKLSTRR